MESHEPSIFGNFVTHLRVKLSNETSKRDLFIQIQRRQSMTTFSKRVVFGVLASLLPLTVWANSYVYNTTDRKVDVVWTAAGCAGLEYVGCKSAQAKGEALVMLPEKDAVTRRGGRLYVQGWHVGSSGMGLCMF
ncbi:MAG: hypothetical protein R3F37_07585 [Candidatus Competibacteraceae bacterium]